MNRIYFPLLLAFALCLVAPPVAARQGESAQDYCGRFVGEYGGEEDYYRCLDEELEADVNTMIGQGLMCSANSCVVVLRCADDVCVDQGYQVKTEYPEYGQRIIITHPHGQTSVYQISHHYYPSEYESGENMGDIRLEWHGPDLILEFDRP